MKIKTNSICFVLVLVLLISIVNISAFGVGCVYTNENPLKLSPGESSDVLINLQNNEVISLKASILVGSDIAKFLDGEVYNVPANGAVDAKLKVNVPASATIGKEYTITLSFLGVSTEGGTVGFNTAIEKSFKVVVVEKPANAETPSIINSTWLIVGVVAILVIIAIVWFAMKKKE